EAEIPPQNGPGPDVTIFPDCHAAHQDGGRVDERGFSYPGAFPFEFVKRHKKILTAESAEDAELVRPIGRIRLTGPIDFVLCALCG
ncbi:MAG: hypothetical protein LUO89_00840, partial [Methanothrix sp.]|nr:hypothetical protein [Methanothrix sp.]